MKAATEDSIPLHFITSKVYDFNFLVVNASLNKKVAAKSVTVFLDLPNPVISLKRRSVNPKADKRRWNSCLGNDSLDSISRSEDICRQLC